MDLKAPGNYLYLLGVTRAELGGSQYHRVLGREGGAVPQTDLALAPRLFAALHTAIQSGWVRACHDLSDGGLAVAVAEMAFAGGVGADLTELPKAAPGESDEVLLFAESTSRFLVEVPPPEAAAFEAAFAALPLTRVGTTCAEPRLRIAGVSGEWVVWASLSDLKQAWQKALGSSENTGQATTRGGLSPGPTGSW
jgi:phosphoribosylformylglycinamidine synthase